MSHYYALAIVPADGDLDDLLAEAMAPFDENRDDVDIDKIPLSWDWYQVGGRFSGRLDGADPERDPRNAGKWPTRWVRSEGDMQDALALTARLATLPDEALPFAIITHGSESVTVRERWTGETFEETGADFRATLSTILSARMAAGLKDRVVVIDYHC